MGFIISKILLMLSLPLSSLLILIAFGFWISRRYPKTGKSLIVSGFFILYLLSIRPVSDMLIRPLESAYPPVEDKFLRQGSSIVILSGGVKDISWAGLSPAPSGSSLQRLIYGIGLYRRVAGSELLISGGSGDPEKPDLSEADAMRDVALSMGIPSDDILIENRSRNTLENVRALKDLLANKDIILVTSASHMYRAASMFEKMGVHVIPAPTGYTVEEKMFSLYSFIPDVGSLGKSSDAVYEYLAILWCRLRGVI